MRVSVLPHPNLSYGRLSSLDGLRGLAALVVVAHHTLLTFPFYSRAYLEPTSAAPPGTLAWWVTATPLHLISEGSEAVLIFFVLSGLVVALPVLRRPTFDWYAYFPRRIIRLVFPAMAAALLAGVITAIAPLRPEDATSGWAARFAIPQLGWPQMVSALDPLSGDGQLNNPVWSLHWEIIFSIALPAYIVLAFALKRFGYWTLGAITLLTWLGTMLNEGSYLYLGVFLLGTIIAFRLDDLRRLTERLARRRWSILLGLGATVGSLILLSIRWIIWGRNPSDGFAVSIGSALALPGAVGLVLVAAFWEPVERFLTTKVMHWLGRVSFSLYLVHVPVILTSRALLKANMLLSVVVAVGASLLLAELFTRFVEIPSHRFSKHIGRVSGEKTRAFFAGFTTTTPTR